GGLTLVASASREQEQAAEDENQMYPYPRVRPSLALPSDRLLPLQLSRDPARSLGLRPDLR
ncbi:MAG: hypothetical protein M3385_10505, partial [Actinomycetota bacterium]|nr:hypothetical protein [Actinomycetota bacterium]